MNTFNFKGFEFRVILLGDLWFVAKDVCDVLGLTNVSQALSHLDDDEKAQVRPTLIGSDSRPGSGPQSITVINEPGLYSLILRSRKPVAREFKRWLTHEVLPTIRQTEGAYIEPESPAASEDPLLLAERTLLIAKEERARAERAESLNATLAPRAVGSTAQESVKDGEAVWDVKYAIKQIFGCKTNDVHEFLYMVGVYDARIAARKSVAPEWRDLLFHTEGGKGIYARGPVRIRPGKQAEFVARVKEQHAFHFGTED